MVRIMTRTYRGINAALCTAGGCGGLPGRHSCQRGYWVKKCGVFALWFRGYNGAFGLRLLSEKVCSPKESGACRFCGIRFLIRLIQGVLTRKATPRKGYRAFIRFIQKRHTRGVITLHKEGVCVCLYKCLNNSNNTSTALALQRLQLLDKSV